MAAELLATCDAYQLRLFAPLLFFGLRAAEPCFLFAEYFEPGWLRVPNNPDLEYRTKGGREKRFPLIPALDPLWSLLRQDRPVGLLYHRRGVAVGQDRPALSGTSLSDLVAEFRRRVVAAGSPGAAGRRTIRDRLLQDAGGLQYDHAEQEFHGIARALGWPRSATLKDLRHLFASTLHNAGLGETYRRYLMGHSLGRSSILAYTHLNELRDLYEAAVLKKWPRLVELAAVRAARFNADRFPPVPAVARRAG
jgi:integrase